MTEQVRIGRRWLLACLPEDLRAPREKFWRKKEPDINHFEGEGKRFWSRCHATWIYTSAWYLTGAIGYTKAAIASSKFRHQVAGSRKGQGVPAHWHPPHNLQKSIGASVSSMFHSKGSEPKKDSLQIPKDAFSYPRESIGGRGLWYDTGGVKHDTGWIHWEASICLPTSWIQTPNAYSQLIHQRWSTEPRRYNIHLVWSPWRSRTSNFMSVKHHYQVRKDNEGVLRPEWPFIVTRKNISSCVLTGKEHTAFTCNKKLLPQAAEVSYLLLEWWSYKVKASYTKVRLLMSSDSGIPLPVGKCGKGSPW